MTLRSFVPYGALGIGLAALADLAGVDKGIAYWVAFVCSILVLQAVLEARAQ